MPPTSRLLYFDLGMNADDDGYTEWFTIVRMSGSTEQDLLVLQANGFVKVFDDNVLVILDWKENNYLRSDRYTPSKYLGKYELGIPNVYQLDTQDRLGKDRLGNNTVAKATPAFIKIGKETFPMDELTYEPLDGKPKGKSKYGRATMAMLVRKFAECAEIEIKGTFDASPWSKPLAAILKYHDGDADAAMAFIERSTGYFESNSLSFTPHTLHKNMPMIDKWIAGQKKDTKTVDISDRRIL